MTKGEAIRKVGRITGTDKEDCELIINMFIEVIKDALSEGKSVSLKNFIRFDIVDRPARKRRNPKTGEIEMYPPTQDIKCVLSRNVKRLVKEE